MIGRGMNLPTANLEIQSDFLPQLGVYASVISFDGKSFMGITNIGHRPTVDSDEKITAETYILDFSGDLYGADITLKLYQKLRETIKFSSKEELRQQIEKDEKRAKAILSRLF
jgi:riboflavin kinase/FMN adenylyltransferase